MKSKKLAIILISVLTVLVAVAATIFIINRPETNNDKKDIIITVIDNNGNEKQFDLQTQKEFLGDVLFESELISEEEHKTGYYTVIDGIRADYKADKAWWCIYQYGKMTEVGANELVVEDQDEFKIVYTPA